MKVYEKLERIKKDFIALNVKNLQKNEFNPKEITTLLCGAALKEKPKKRNKKILIVAGCFGPEKGLGHLFRSIFLYELITLQGYSGCIVVSNKSEESTLKKRGIPFRRSTQMNLFSSENLYEKRKEDLIKIITTYNPYQVISEEDFLTPCICFEIGIKCIGFVGSELYFPLYPSYLLCDYVFTTEENIDISIDILKERMIYSTPLKLNHVGEISRESLEPMSEKIKKKYGKFILITFGGSFINNDYFNFEDLLRNISKDYTGTVLVTKDGKSNEKVIYLGFKENLPDFIKAADLVISHAGLSTASELKQNNTFAILFPLPVLEQKINALQMSKLGYLTFENLSQFVERFSEILIHLQKYKDKVSKRTKENIKKFNVSVFYKTLEA